MARIVKLKLDGETKDQILYECRQMLWEMVKMLFTEAFDSKSFKDERVWLSYGSEYEVSEVAAILGKAVGDKARLEFEKGLREEVSKAVRSTLDHIKSERFIDEMIDRINRKQLG